MFTPRLCLQINNATSEELINIYPMNFVEMVAATGRAQADYYYLVKLLLINIYPFERCL